MGSNRDTNSGQRGNRALVLVVALALAVICIAGWGWFRATEPTGQPVQGSSGDSLDSKDAEALPHIEALIVPPTAEKVSYDAGWRESQHVGYIVAEPYPAAATLEYVSSQLRDRGWRPLDEDWLNPGSPSSHIQGWSEHIDLTTDRRLHVRRWMGQWEDPNGNVVTYSFRYYHIQPDVVEVSGGWYSRADAEISRAQSRAIDDLEIEADQHPEIIEENELDNVLPIFP